MHPPLSTQTTTTVIGAGGVPKTVTKQTIILTYQAQQIASHVSIELGAEKNKNHFFYFSK